MDRKVKSSNLSFFFTQTPVIIWLCICFIQFISPGLSHLCYMELQPALKRPFFHLSFKKRKTFFFSVPGKKCLVASPGSFCLYCEQLWHKSVLSFSWFLPGTILSCRDPLWGPEADVSLAVICVCLKSIFSPFNSAWNSGQWWGRGWQPCHHTCHNPSAAHVCWVPVRYKASSIC